MSSCVRKIEDGGGHCLLLLLMHLLESGIYVKKVMKDKDNIYIVPLIFHRYQWAPFVGKLVRYCRMEALFVRRVYLEFVNHELC